MELHAVYLLVCLFLRCQIVYGCHSCYIQIDNTLKQTIKCWSNQIAGMSVSVVRSDKTLFEGGYGVTDIETRKPVSENTLFGIASLSKGFASTLLVKLLEEKTKFSINTELKTILENNGIFADNLRSSYVTVLDLLSHRVGIPKNNKIRLDTNLTRAGLVDRLKFLKAKGKFRDSFYYNNLMYGVITYMAEVIGEDSWERLVKKYIFDPLGMTSSSFMTTYDNNMVELAKGYVDYYGNLKPVPYEFSRRWAELCGSGCVLSTARDMAKWMKFFLNNGKLPNGTQLVSKSAFKNIIRPSNVIAKTYTSTYFTKPKIPVTTSQTGYALGWRTGHYRGYSMLIHSGSTFGYRTLLSIYPDVDLAIFTAMTGNDPNYFYRQTLHNFIFDSYTGYGPWLNSSTICSYPYPWLKAKTSKSKPKKRQNRNLSRPRNAYYGIFNNPAYGYLEVKPHEDMNKLSVNYGYATFTLYPKSAPDEFYGHSIGITENLFNFYTFTFKFQGGNLSLTIPNFETSDPPVFIKGSQNNGKFSPSSERFIKDANIEKPFIKETTTETHRLLDCPSNGGSIVKNGSIVLLFMFVLLFC